MAKFFQRGQNTVSPRQALEMKYNSARVNLLLLLAFTVINIILVLFGANTYFLFSASIPYSIVYLGALFCGKLPAEQYEGTGLTEADFFPSSVLAVTVVIAVVILALYVLAWLLSKKKVGWLIFALVLFVLDTIMMFFFWGISFDTIFDLLFHLWMLYYLVAGIRAHGQLKKLGDEEPIFPDTATEGNPLDESVFTITENDTEQK